MILGMEYFAGWNFFYLYQFFLLLGGRRLKSFVNLKKRTYRCDSCLGGSTFIEELKSGNKEVNA